VSLLLGVRIMLTVLPIFHSEAVFTVRFTKVYVRVGDRLTTLVFSIDSKDDGKRVALMLTYNIG